MHTIRKIIYSIQNTQKFIIIFLTNKKYFCLAFIFSTELRKKIQFVQITAAKFITFKVVN